MNKIGKIVIIVAVVVAIGAVITLKQKKPSSLAVEIEPRNTTNAIQAEKDRNRLSAVEQSKALPCLVDLGADKCIPCKMMAPILEELKEEYTNRLEVIFIDVWKNPSKAEEYGIKLIPTQIFLDASGEELFRHEGFFSKKDILSKWKELGVEFEKTK